MKEDRFSLLPTGARKVDSKSKKAPTRAANALFCGVVFGFIFSFLFAYIGVFDESENLGYDVHEFMAKNDNSNAIEVDETPTTNLAAYLHGTVRVLCMVMINEEALKQRGSIIMDTWGKRCNKLLFFSNKIPVNFTLDNVVVVEGDQMEMMTSALQHVHKNHLNDFDWFLRTNDNTFMVLENLRHLLFQYDTDWPVVVGQRFLKEVLLQRLTHPLDLFKIDYSKDYMIGVYVLSKRALTRLIVEAFTNEEICSKKSVDDDKEISKCLQRVNVIQVDGIDREGKGMFFRNNPESALFPERFDKHDEFYMHKLKQGIDNCCSDRLIAIQNTHNSHLYYLDYFIYKVRAFGRRRNPEPLPPKFTLDEIIKNNY